MREKWDGVYDENTKFLLIFVLSCILLVNYRFPSLLCKGSVGYMSVQTHVHRLDYDLTDMNTRGKIMRLHRCIYQYC